MFCSTHLPAYKNCLAALRGGDSKHHRDSMQRSSGRQRKMVPIKSVCHLQCLLDLHREIDSPLHLKTDWTTSVLEFWWPPPQHAWRILRSNARRKRGSCSKPTGNFLPTMVLRLTNKSLQSSWAGWNIAINGIFISNGAGVWFVSDRLTAKTFLKKNKLHFLSLTK